MLLLLLLLLMMLLLMMMMTMWWRHFSRAPTQKYEPWKQLRWELRAWSILAARWWDRRKQQLSMAGLNVRGRGCDQVTMGKPFWNGWNPVVHPGRLTWNLQISHLERKMIFQTSMIMFHVNLQGCKHIMLFFYLTVPTMMCVSCCYYRRIVTFLLTGIGWIGMVEGCKWYIHVYIYTLSVKAVKLQ